MKPENEKTILHEIGVDALSKRGDLITLHKAQGRGNVILDLVHGAYYKYGDTIQRPQIVLSGIAKRQFNDLDFFEFFDCYGK